MAGRAKAALAVTVIVIAVGAAAAASTPLLRPDHAPALQYLALVIGTISWAVTIVASLLVRPFFTAEIIAPPLAAWSVHSTPAAATVIVIVLAAALWGVATWLLLPALQKRARSLLAALIIALALTLLQLPYLTPESRPPLPARIAAALTSPLSALLARAGVPELYKPGSGYLRRMSLSDSTAAHFWATALALFVLIMLVHRTRLWLMSALLVLIPPPLLAQQAREVVNWPGGIVFTYDGSGSVARMGDDELLYDDVGRLVQAKMNGATRKYEYDAFGNRKNCLQSDGAACQFGYGVNANDNHLTGTVAYDPSGSGNVTALGAHHYQWDAANILTADRDAGTEFLYTADDERLATHAIHAASWQWSVRDVHARILRQFSSGEGTSGWQWSRDYVWRDGLLLASRQPEDEVITTYHYHLDHLGTPRRVTNDEDDLAGFHDYHAFGPEIAGGLHEPSRNALQYTGQERDDTGVPYTLDYLHARYDNPALGRFLSLDPLIPAKRALARPQAWNRYAYAENNPLTLRDPDGRQAADATNAAGAKAAWEALSPAVREEYLRAFTALYSGFLYATQGNQNKADKAKAQIQNAAIGLAVVSLAQTIPEVVKDAVNQPLPPPLPPDPR
ncbi:MAG TPA: RHS repeat-associated core domain-containing protein [Thermoanaerobaculia bacterium]|jgi:RHS repeat-associated protein|nr:RHS repeat-associated core domain-containing protein [Thermoanaerobaculia bacterium]